MKHLIFTVLALGVGCAGQTKHGGDEIDTASGPAPCESAPAVDHDEYRDPWTVGENVPIEATVVGDPTEGCEHVEVLGVWLHYKQEGDGASFRTPIKMDNIEGDTFTAIIPGPDVATSKILYYFQAVGQSKEAIDPEGAPDKDSKAYYFKISI